MAPDISDENNYTEWELKKQSAAILVRLLVVLRERDILSENDVTTEIGIQSVLYSNIYAGEDKIYEFSEWKSYTDKYFHDKFVGFANDIAAQITAKYQTVHGESPVDAESLLIKLKQSSGSQPIIQKSIVKPGKGTSDEESQGYDVPQEFSDVKRQESNVSQKIDTESQEGASNTDTSKKYSNRTKFGVGGAIVLFLSYVALRLWKKVRSKNEKHKQNVQSSVGF